MIAAFERLPLEGTDGPRAYSFRTETQSWTATADDLAKIDRSKLSDAEARCLDGFIGLIERDVFAGLSGGDQA